LTGITGYLTAFGRTILAAVYKGTGVLVGVGIAPTKNLAKLANYTARRLQPTRAAWWISAIL
jgi:DNA polymerase V